MPTFLRSSNVYAPRINSIHAHAKTRLRLTRHSHQSRYHALVSFVLLLALIAETGARAASYHNSFSLAVSTTAVSSLSKPYKKRILMLRRNESVDGARFTLMADAPLDDYQSFAEADRVCVMIPQAAFVSTRNDSSGRGFAEMRVEQRDEGVVFSFRLQQGATVAVNQNFNRLDVIFITNERANAKGLN
jgi:hypothetical protein